MFKRFKWFIVLASVLAIPVTIGAMPSIASAAGCSSGGLSNVTRSAYPVPAWFHNQITVSGCTGVNYIQVYTNISNTNIHDVAPYGNFAAGPFQVDGLYSFNNPYQKGVVSGSATVNFEYGCWFSGVHPLEGVVQYRVHYTSGSFGSVQTRYSGLSYIGGC